MNKLVYLYELDSTRISPWEIDRGRKALYEEIVMRGNRVVLTFQQLTDSKIFLELLKDKKDFEIITSLFENGALRLSEYCDPHTGKRICSASQYLQNALEGVRRKLTAVSELLNLVDRFDIPAASFERRIQTIVEMDMQLSVDVTALMGAGIELVNR